MCDSQLSAKSHHRRVLGKGKVNTDTSIGRSWPRHVVQHHPFHIFMDTLLVKLQETMDEIENDWPIHARSRPMAYVDDICILIHIDRKRLNDDG